MLRTLDPTRRDLNPHDPLGGREVAPLERFDELNRRGLERETLGLDQSARIRLGGSTPPSLAQLDRPAPVAAHASHASATPRLWDGSQVNAAACGLLSGSRC
ncbi:MAG: hypothetical protein ACRDKS_01185 [Actinomycetota bacterium]